MATIEILPRILAALGRRRLQVRSQVTFGQVVANKRRCIFVVLPMDGRHIVIGIEHIAFLELSLRALHIFIFKVDAESEIGQRRINTNHVLFRKTFRSAAVQLESLFRRSCRLRLPIKLFH